MFIFGHLGFGSWLAKPFIGADIENTGKKRLLRPGLPLRWVLLGCLLPDIIDKSLYYGLSWATGKRAQELGLICGTRTFGHTAIFAMTITVLSFFTRSKRLAGLSIGIATHLLLDNFGNVFTPWSKIGQSSPLLWPFTGWQFPIYPFSGILQHLKPTPFIVGSEIVGLILFILTYYRYTQGKRFVIR